MAPKVFALPALAVLALAAPVGAHHSVAGQFDATQRTTITGVVSKVDWINPHVYIFMDVTDESGAATTWRLESLPTAMLRKAGLTSELIKGGGEGHRRGVMARNGAEFGLVVESLL
jgi:hypothetical protein